MKAMKPVYAASLGTLAAAFVVLVAPSVSYAAFGISPPFLNADHLVPGATYSQTIYLVQDQPVDDLPIVANLELPDAVKNWISIDRGMSFIIPKGTRQFPVVVTVKTPQGTALAKYSGNLTFSTQPNTGGQVAISLGANLAINLTVGNDIFEKYSVPLITISDIEEGWSPRVFVKFQNDGNIPESFDAATFDLYDHFDAVRLAYVSKQDGFTETPPFVTNEYFVEFPIDFHLGVGDYWGVVNFYKHQQFVASQKTVFHVLPTGTLSGTMGIITKFFKDNSLALGGAASILIAGIYFGIRRARLKKRAKIA